MQHVFKLAAVAALVGQRQSAVSDALRLSLLRSRVDHDALERIHTPMAGFELIDRF